MKLVKKVAAYMLFASVLLVGAASCSKESDNHEAEIEAVQLKEPVSLGNAAISGVKITIYVSKDADATKLSPVFKLSSGATISPKNGSTQDFTKPVKYVVTSEDKAVTREYEVSVRREAMLSNPFDSWEKKPADASSDNSIYYTPTNSDWSTANIGNVLLRGLGYNVKNTVDQTEDAFQGAKAAIIRTEFVSDKPVFGQNTPIATGSLFLGSFTTLHLMTDPLKCTSFGVPITRKPLSVSGYYKYLPGDKLTDENFTVIPNGKDSCAIYAVVFTGTEPLNGRNVLTDSRIIAKAVLKGGKQPVYTKFDLVLDYKRDVVPGENLMFTIVCSSSWDGNIFKGAVGSTLFVDDIKVTTKNI